MSGKRFRPIEPIFMANISHSMVKYEKFIVNFGSENPEIPLKIYIILLYILLTRAATGVK
jgi:hypothetical protein